MKAKFFGRGKIDVDNPDDYKYVDPIWDLLRKTPDQSITWDVVGKKTGLKKEIAVPMVQEIASLFMKKMSKALLIGDITSIDPDKFWDENLKESWLFDKVMLMTMKINTGIENEIWETNPFMQDFKRKWVESKGM